MDDREVDDILENSKARKTKAKGKPKGKRGELLVVKLFNERFADILSKNPEWGQFSRSVGSGNRWGQNVHLSQQAKNTFSGDITCPENFRFVIESKIGYNDIDLYNIIAVGHESQINNFLKQVEDDSERCGRYPLLIWKKDRKNPIVFFDVDIIKEYVSRFDINIIKDYTLLYDYKFQYSGKWSIMSLDDFFLFPDDLFFD